ncbi:MAG: chemotaxis response regulator protein-glutamate methylesterase [Steroidobacteraceae bacterium]
MTRNKIRVLIVDDNAIDRELLTSFLEEQPDFEVVGQAADAFEARGKVKSLRPDVLTLDVSMPGMSGIQFLSNLMRLQPMPVVMCSATTEAGADVTLEALAIGAVDFVTKPGTGSRTLTEYRDTVVAKLRAAAYAQVRRPTVTGATGAPLRTTPGSQSVPAHPAAARLGRAVDVIAIGASTGGVAAIESLLETVPAGVLPPVLVTQHIPAGFSRRFAERLHAQLPHTVLEATPDARLEPGHVYIAPGGQQFSIVRRGDGYRCVVERGERVNLHRPSVDVLFHSVAEHAGSRAIGVMLTGMGSDGAQGMRAMRERGAYNIVQDEASSTVWGMPGAAAELGAAHLQLPLPRIGPTLCQIVGAVVPPPRD